MPKPEFENEAKDILNKYDGDGFLSEQIASALRKLYVMGLNEAKEIVINHNCPNGYSCKDEIELSIEAEASRIEQDKS